MKPDIATGAVTFKLGFTAISEAFNGACALARFGFGLGALIEPFNPTYEFSRPIIGKRHPLIVCRRGIPQVYVGGASCPDFPLFMINQCIQYLRNGTDYARASSHIGARCPPTEATSNRSFLPLKFSSHKD